VDALSRPNDDERQAEEKKITLIPFKTFINLTNTDPMSSLEYQLLEQQWENQRWIEDLKEKHQL
jgi:hypothetical protein